MIIATSLHTSRVERQQYCVQTWLNLGLRVVAVQAPGETDTLRPLFPYVTFKEYPLPEKTMYSKATPSIKNIANQSIEENDYALILNSDISIKDSQTQFYQRWVPKDDALTIGIRWNGSPGSKKRTRESWGIDAFLLSPQMALMVPEMGFQIGLPGWDFWMVYLFHLAGYHIETSRSRLFHHRHDKGWNSQDQLAYRRMVCEHYGHASTTFLPRLIKTVTGR